MGGPEEEGAQIFTDIFRGGLGGEPPLKIPFVGVGSPYQPPPKMGAILGGGWGGEPPLQSFFRGGSTPGRP